MPLFEANPVDESDADDAGKRAFEIVQKAGSLLAPGQGTETSRFRVFRVLSIRRIRQR